MVHNYIDSCIQQFHYYKLLAERTFDQLKTEEMHWQYNAESNSIAIIMNHICGNIRSRWTDFLTTDGEKPWRNRDTEFEKLDKSKEELMKSWEAAWSLVFQTLKDIDEDNINQKVVIRNQIHTITEAVNRQLMHYAYHIGQIIYIGRMIRGKEWNSLSIPKNQSTEYNENKFSRGIHGGHFSED